MHLAAPVEDNRRAMSAEYSRHILTAPPFPIRKGGNCGGASA